MLKKMITLCMLMSGCAHLHAAAQSDSTGSLSRVPYFGAAYRMVDNGSAHYPFQVHGTNESTNQHLFFIADTLGDVHTRMAAVQKKLANLPKGHTESDVEAILKSATQNVAQALFVLVDAKQVVISRKGLDSKALLVLREGPLLEIGYNTLERIVARMGQPIPAYKGIVFTRGVSRSDEDVNETIKTTLAQEGATPTDVARAIVQAESGESVAAAFLDYDKLAAEMSVVGPSAPVREKNKKCIVQ